MKKLSFIAIVGMLFATATTSNAQLFTAALPAEEKKFDPASAPAAPAINSSASFMLSKAGSRAVNNFKTKFVDGPDVQWFAEGKVMSASFKRDGVYTSVVYDNKGRWMRDMKVYNADLLSSEIKDLIKRSKYRNSTINSVQEILEDDLKFYVVHLENDKSFEQIIVCNNEIGLYSRIKKQQ